MRSVRKKAHHYSLLLLLTFLQCLVPLLHAHADGLHVTSHIHVHDHGAGASAFHSGQKHVLEAESCDSPVVGAVSEFKRDWSFAGFAGAPSMLLLILPESARDAPIVFTVVFSSSRLYWIGPPPAHAPPAFA